MVYLFVQDNDFREEINYAFDLLFNIMGVNYSLKYEKANMDDIVVIYGDRVDFVTCAKKIIINESKSLFNKNYLKTMPNIEINKFILEKKIGYFNDIILLFGNNNYSIDYKEDTVKTNIDFVSNIFFIVSRYEEYLCEEKDEHKRFCHKSSELFKAGLIDRPIVNEYAKLLFEIIRYLDKDIVEKSYWDEKEYAFCVSHDIDSIFKYRDKFCKSLIIKLGRERDIIGVVEMVKNLLVTYKDINNDPFWSFDYMLDLEKQYNFTSSYYFMTGGSSKKDNFYNINNRTLTSVFDKIKKGGSEIGIHGSYNSYNEVKMLGAEVNNFKFIGEMLGIRQHYLRFDVKNTWNNQILNGFKYDTTLGFAGAIGFRAGICSPFKPFDLNSRKKLDIWEIPLIVMDGTLADEQYMNLNKEEALKYVKLLMDRVKSVNGVFTLLWHNSSFDKTNQWEAWNNVYESILKYAYDTNAMGVSGIELVNQYNK